MRDVQVKLSSQTMRHAGSALLATAFILLHSGLAAQSPPSDAKEAKRLELYKLTNEELVRQSRAMLDKAMREYLASQRAPATVEALLERSRNQTEAIQVPPEPSLIPKEGQPPSLDAAKAVLNATKIRVEALKRRQESLSREKAVLDLFSRTVDSNRSAATTFMQVLDDLDSFLFEMNLRVKDGSLKADAIPEDFRPEALAGQRKQLNEARESSRKKWDGIYADIDRMARKLDEVLKDIHDAESQVNLALALYNQEEKRTDLERQLSDKKPEELQVEMNHHLAVDSNLKAEFDAASSRFVEKRKELEAMKASLEKTAPPADALPEIDSAEHVEAAARTTRLQIEYYAKRAETLRRLRAGYKELIDLGNRFEGESTVLGDHIFTMQIIDRVVRNRKDSGMVPPGPSPARLTDDASRARAFRKAVQTEDPILEKQIAAAVQSGEDASRRLAILTQYTDVAKRMSAWEEAQKSASPAAVVESFNRIADTLEAKLKGLQSERAAYEAATTLVVESQARREQLKNPFLREIEQQSQGERQKILEDLQQFAGIPRLRSDGFLMVNVPASPSGPAPVLPSVPATPAPAAAKPKPGVAENLKAFQQTVTSRMRVVYELEDVKAKELKAVDALFERITSFSDALNEARTLAMQQHAIAIDLKKRVAAGLLPAEAVTDRVTRALKRTIITLLDNEAVSVLNARVNLFEERQALAKQYASRSTYMQLIENVLKLVGTRIDTYAELNRLQEDFRRERKDMPESETKRIEQAAADRHERDSWAGDFLLRLDASRHAGNLSELLNSYFVELIEFEEKEENLAKQKAKIDQLIELTMKESADIGQLTPIIAGFQKTLEAERDEILLLARASLRPETADELLRTHQAKTGRELAKPLPIPEKEKPERIRKIAAELHGKYAKLEDIRQWGATLNDRLSSAGLKAEIASYQDMLDAAKSKSVDNQRRISYLAGSSASAQAATEGEIASVRKELRDLRLRNIYWIFGKIAAIAVGIYLLPKIIAYGLRNLLGVSKKQSHGALVLSFLKTFAKVAVWILGAILILSTLGFDITAILAGLGIGGLAIGLASQHMIANVLSGIVIFVERPFSIGDRIKVSGHNAQVVGLTWRTTVLENMEGGGLINVPNSAITGATIENMTRKWVD